MGLIWAILIGIAYAGCEDTNVVVLRHIDSNHVLVGHVEDSRRKINEYAGKVALLAVSDPISRGFEIQELFTDESDESVETAQGILTSQSYIYSAPPRMERVGRARFEGREVDLWRTCE